jgi:hypothetical protein
LFELFGGRLDQGAFVGEKTLLLGAVLVTIASWAKLAKQVQSAAHDIGGCKWPKSLPGKVLYHVGCLVQRLDDVFDRG